jgi:limonene-1,2-epoxide hydrolase
MRRFAALGLVLVSTAGPGAAAATRSPAQVVRAWSRALNANRNAAAARLFARDARVVQAGVDVRLSTRALAVGFNDALPCAGRITRLRVHGATVVATFVLGERPKHRCDGPGQRAAAKFVVRKGRIVLWQQVPVPPDGPTV